MKKFILSCVAIMSLLMVTSCGSSETCELNIQDISYAEQKDGLAGDYLFSVIPGTYTAVIQDQPGAPGMKVFEIKLKLKLNTQCSGNFDYDKYSSLFFCNKVEFYDAEGNILSEANGANGYPFKPGEDNMKAGKDDTMQFAQFLKSPAGTEIEIRFGGYGDVELKNTLNKTARIEVKEAEPTELGYAGLTPNK